MYNSNIPKFTASKSLNSNNHNYNIAYSDHKVDEIIPQQITSEDCIPGTVIVRGTSCDRFWGILNCKCVYLTYEHPNRYSRFEESCGICAIWDPLGGPGRRD